MKKYILIIILTLSQQSFSQNEKSKPIAIALSALFPGLGEYYLSENNNWKASAFSEVAIVGSYIGIKNYGNDLKNDSRNFAFVHSNAQKNQDDLYYARIGNYSSVYRYNEYTLQERNYDNLYLPAENYFWNWDNETNRNEYHSLRVKSDRIIENSSFLIAAMFVNRAISIFRIIGLKDASQNEINNWSLQMKSGENFQNKKHFSCIF